MNRPEIEAAVRRVLQTVVGRELAAGEELSRADEPRWDSLKHVEILFGVEEALGIQYDAEELAELDSVGKLVAAAEARLRRAG